MVLAPKLYLHLAKGCRTPSDNIVYRFACRNNDRLPEFATELVGCLDDCHHRGRQPPSDIRRKSSGCESIPFADHARLHRARERRSRSMTFGIATLDSHRAGMGRRPMSPKKDPVGSNRRCSLSTYVFGEQGESEPALERQRHRYLCFGGHRADCRAGSLPA
jgi:hypothetical protein